MNKMHILTGYNRDTEETFGVRRHYVSPVTEVIGFKSRGLMSWSVPDIPVNPPEDPKILMTLQLSLIQVMIMEVR